MQIFKVKNTKSEGQYMSTVYNIIEKDGASQLQIFLGLKLVGDFNSVLVRWIHDFTIKDLEN